MMLILFSSIGGALIGTGLYNLIYGHFRAEKLKGAAVTLAEATIVASALLR